MKRNQRLTIEFHPQYDGLNQPLEHLGFSEEFAAMMAKHHYKHTGARLVELTKAELFQTPGFSEKHWREIEVNLDWRLFWEEG